MLSKRKVAYVVTGLAAAAALVTILAGDVSDPAVGLMSVSGQGGQAFLPLPPSQPQGTSPSSPQGGTVGVSTSARVERSGRAGVLTAGGGPTLALGGETTLFIPTNSEGSLIFWGGRRTGRRGVRRGGEHPGQRGTL